MAGSRPVRFERCGSTWAIRGGGREGCPEVDRFGNHDRGGNCILLALGGARTQNLHAYWDSNVVQALGSDPAQVAAMLRARITPAQRA